MKYFVLIILIAMTVGLSNCKEGKLFTFYVEDQTTTTIENILPVESPIDIPTPDITTNSTQEFENHDTKINLVKEIVLRELMLTIISPDDEDFSFLKDISIYISADGEEEILLASLNDINSETNTISLELTEEILDNYVKKESYSLRTEAVTRETLLRDVDIQIDLKFRVTADLI
ncbi:MAG: hypothetical protein U9N85_09190 [Bacteroidota bacterium]|nr:hypothetical protein [Bacteroidota bacterium]